jgi:hypothetical protein
MKAAPQLQVRIEAKIEIEVSFDMIEYFRHERMKGEQTQRNYWGLDLEEWGFDGEEHCRPIAWLTSEVNDAYETTGLYGFGKDSPINDQTSDLEFESERVSIRGGKYAGPPNTSWTQEDFDVLAGAVPWLGKPPVEAPNEPESMPLFPISTDVVSSSAGG